MDRSNGNATATGILFILGTVPIIAAMLLWGGSLSAPDYLSSIAANRTSVLLYALAIVVMGLSCAGIGISMYPVLRRYGQGRALAVAGFRVMEGILSIVGAIGVFALLTLSQEFAKAGYPANSFFQPAGAAIQAARDLAANGTGSFAWCAAAFIYYSIFYRTRLVPRWLSVWGIVGLVLYLVSAFASIFGFMGYLSQAQFLFSMPILIQELVLAAWLLVKGYDPEALVGPEA